MRIAFMKSLDELLSYAEVHGVFEIFDGTLNFSTKYKIWEKFVKDGGMKK